MCNPLSRAPAPTRGSDSEPNRAKAARAVRRGQTAQIGTDNIMRSIGGTGTRAACGARNTCGARGALTDTAGTCSAGRSRVVAPVAPTGSINSLD
jgi:hypothetical protein